MKIIWSQFEFSIGTEQSHKITGKRHAKIIFFFCILNISELKRTNNNNKKKYLCEDGMSNKNFSVQRCRSVVKKRKSGHKQ